MSSERAATHTSGALNREKALPIVVNWRTQYLITPGDLLDALEACVVPDPRLARIEALLERAEGHGIGAFFLADMRAILRGDQ